MIIDPSLFDRALSHFPTLCLLTIFHTFFLNWSASQVCMSLPCILHIVLSLPLYCLFLFQAPDSASVAPATPVRKNTAKNTPIKTPAHVMLNETLESIGSRGTPVKQEELIKKLQEHQSILEEQDKAYQVVSYQ